MTHTKLSRRDLFRFRFLRREAEAPSHNACPLEFTEQTPPGEIIFYDQLTPVDIDTIVQRRTRNQDGTMGNLAMNVSCERAEKSGSSPE